MTLPDEQRHLLGAFLRTHREALAANPATTGRRRTPGLRREDLFELTRRRDPEPPVAESDAVPDALLCLLQTMSAPAYLLDRLWRVRGHNPPAARLFAPWFDSDEPCLLRFVFLVPAARAFIWDWENRARRLLAEFRADTAQDPHDRFMRELVDGLQRDSPTFATFWNDHAVLSRGGGERVFNHPLDGTVRYQQMTLLPSSHPAHKVVILLPDRG